MSFEIESPDQIVAESGAMLNGGCAGLISKWLHWRRSAVVLRSVPLIFLAGGGDVLVEGLLPSRGVIEAAFTDREIQFVGCIRFD